MVQIFAHRGSSGTHPENTLPAFAEAVRVNADGIELDVHLTENGELVVIHDEEVDRTTNGKGLIREKTLEEIKKLNAGLWFNDKFPAAKIPTLKEVLDLLLQKNYRGTVMIEIKTDKYEYAGIEEKVSKLLTNSVWPFQHAYCSFNIDSLKRLSLLETDVQLDLLLSSSQKKVTLAKNTTYLEGIHPKVDWYFSNLEEVQAFPKAIRCWTINEEAQMIQCFNQPMDAIITDFPERAIRLKQSMKK